MIAGIGTEIVECERIAALIAELGERFVQRVFTESEANDASRRRRCTERFAMLWASKEAVWKALGTPWHPGLDWHDVEIVHAPGEPPDVRLAGAASEQARHIGATRVLLSASATPNYATATAIAISGGFATGDLDDDDPDIPF